MEKTSMMETWITRGKVLLFSGRCNCKLYFFLQNRRSCYPPRGGSRPGYDAVLRCCRLHPG